MIIFINEIARFIFVFVSDTCYCKFFMNFFIQPGNKLVANSKAAVPTVSDNAVALQLTKSGKNTQVALDELKSAADKVYFGIMRIFVLLDSC